MLAGWWWPTHAWWSALSRRWAISSRARTPGKPRRISRTSASRRWRSGISKTFYSDDADDGANRKGRIVYRRDRDGHPPDRRVLPTGLVDAKVVVPHWSAHADADRIHGQELDAVRPADRHQPGLAVRLHRDR